ncbi:hypothetical protein BJX62DRAFT_23159 [Aspergillus germanicus]
MRDRLLFTAELGVTAVHPDRTLPKLPYSYPNLLSRPTSSSSSSKSSWILSPVHFLLFSLLSRLDPLLLSFTPQLCICLSRSQSNPCRTAAQLNV